MARFEYIARDESGAATSGEIVAASRVEAAKLLRNAGKFVVKLDEAAQKRAKPTTRRRGSRRVRQDQILYFANQLAIMVDTGVPLAEALAATIEDEPASGFRRVVEDVIAQIQAGQEFSAALARHPKVFPKYFANVIRAAEASGMLGTMLQRLASYMSTQRQTRRSLVRAMMYPVAMIGFCTMVAIFLLTFLIPRFVSIFESRGAALPKPTQILLGVSGFFGDNSLWLVPLLLATVIGAWLYKRTPRGRITVSWLKIRTPIFGSMFRKAYITSSMRTMGTMIDAGVSMLETVAITREIVDNHYYEQLFEQVDTQLRKGSLLSDSLKDSGLFPRAIVQMILAGERAGQMGPVMDRVSQFCDRELSDAIQTAIQLIQPLLVIFMGVFIGGVVVALLLPIFTLSRVISGAG